MFDSLLTFLANCREPMTAAGLWSDLEIIRANGSPCVDLPATFPELQRQLRHAKVAGLVTEDGGAYRVAVRKPKAKQAELFA